MLKKSPFLIVAGCLFASACDGPGKKATDAWETACETGFGTDIVRTVENVGGFVFEGEERIHVRSSTRKGDEILKIVPVLSLFDEREKLYDFVEFEVSESGIHDQFYRTLDLPVGKYRITREPIEAPICRKFEAYARPDVGQCLAITPIPEFSARYGVAYLEERHSTEDYSVTSEDYEISDFADGAVIAASNRHTLSWRDTGFGVNPYSVETKTKSCPLEGEGFNIRSILKPVDGG